MWLMGGARLCWNFRQFTAHPQSRAKMPELTAFDGVAAGLPRISGG
jgi:hypothetical protein